MQVGISNSHLVSSTEFIAVRTCKQIFLQNKVLSLLFRNCMKEKNIEKSHNKLPLQEEKTGDYFFENYTKDFEVLVFC